MSKLSINLDYNGEIPRDYREINGKMKNFPSGEFEFSINEDIAKSDVKVFQTFKLGEFNNQIIKLLITCDVLKRNNAKSVTLYAPFLPYFRQDKIDETKTSLGSNLLVDLLSYAKIDKIITYDLHITHIEKFFTKNIEHKSMIPQFLTDIKSKFKDDEITIVFPDSGSALRFKDFIKDLNLKFVIINKERKDDKITMEINDSVLGQKCVILDDIIDGGGTMIEAANLLKNQGANEIFAYAAHGIFSNSAQEKLEKSNISEIVVSNSLDVKSSGKIRVINI